MSLGTVNRLKVATGVNCYVIRWQNNTLKGASNATEHLITKKGTKFKDTADVARSDICCQCSPKLSVRLLLQGPFSWAPYFFTQKHLL